MGNRLSKIYTKTGDDGTTGLGDGTRRAKHDLRVEAFGAVDEANSAIGLARAETRGASAPTLAAIEATLARTQNDLFDLGADLCAPPAAGGTDARLRVAPSQVEALERAIDDLNAHLEPLRSFVLPGGSRAACWRNCAAASPIQAGRKKSATISSGC